MERQPTGQSTIKSGGCLDMPFVSTYDQIAHILDKAGGKNIEQTVHAQTPKLGKVYQVIVLCEKASGNDSKQTSEQEDGRGLAFAFLGSMVIDLNFTACLHGAFVAWSGGFGGGFGGRFGRGLVPNQSSAESAGHPESRVPQSDRRRGRGSDGKYTLQDA